MDDKLFWTNSFDRCIAPLPHDFRRKVYSLLFPGRFRSLQVLRETQSADGYSLKCFDSRKCIFVHIPKCGGVSVAKSLLGNLGGGHRSIKKYQITFSERDFNNYFKFSFVRNPWDRLVSAFHYLKAGGFVEIDRRWAHAHLRSYSTFGDFVKGWVTTRNVNSWSHFSPQIEFLRGYRKTVDLDFVGLFENLHEDFDYVCKQLGARADLRWLNRNVDVTDYRTYYCDETIKIVERVYQADVQYFGYAFDNSSLDRQIACRPR